MWMTAVGYRLEVHNCQKNAVSESNPPGSDMGGSTGHSPVEHPRVQTPPGVGVRSVRLRYDLGHVIFTSKRKSDPSGGGVMCRTPPRGGGPKSHLLSLLSNSKLSKLIQHQSQTATLSFHTDSKLIG